MQEMYLLHSSYWVGLLSNLGQDTGSPTVRHQRKGHENKEIKGHVGPTDFRKNIQKSTKTPSYSICP